MFVDDDLLSLEGAETIVDALVSDEPFSANIRQPPGAFDTFGRSSTPSVPPGLGLPQPVSNPSPSVSHSSLLSHSIPQTPPVALPIVPVKATASTPTPQSAKKATSTSVPEAKKNIKALAVESGLSKDIARVKTQKTTLQDEDFPALGTPKVSQPAPTPPVSSSKPTANKPSASQSKKAATEKLVDKGKSPAPPASTGPAKAEQRAPEKRPTPGILNIAAATKATQSRAIETASAAEKSSSDKDSAFPALPTPTTASVSSPLARAAPKTLRVVQTPRVEAPPTPSGNGAPLAGPSVRTTASAAIRPETPVSELISDSASIISATISASRTSSPPPSKVGSAPVRSTTKSQQRKQRKEALKKDTATIAAQPVKVDPEVEIAPIVGRKKKQKKEKEKEKAPSGNATPTASRPETPLPAPVPPAPAPTKEAKEVKETKKAPEAAKEESSTYRSTVNETMTLTDEPLPKSREYESKGKNSETSKSSDFNSTPRSLPTPAMVLLELQKAGEVSASLDELAFFRPMSWQTDKLRIDFGGNPESKSEVFRTDIGPSGLLTPDEVKDLQAGKPVRKTIKGVRFFYTPNGDCLKNMTAEEEDSFLKIQTSVAKMNGKAGAFAEARLEATPGCDLVKGRAVPNGLAFYMPEAPCQYSKDVVGKLRSEEAVHYINQYHLPEHTKPNGRDPMVTKKMISNWNFEARVAAAGDKTGPWMFGPTTMVMYGDTAAPELNYPGPVGSFNEADDKVVDCPSPSGCRRSHHVALPGIKPPSLVVHALGNACAVPIVMTVEDAEASLSVLRKETEKLEKQLSQLVRKNRRMLTMGSTGGGH